MKQPHNYLALGRLSCETRPNIEINGASYHVLIVKSYDAAKQQKDLSEEDGLMLALHSRLYIETMEVGHSRIVTCVSNQSPVMKEKLSDYLTETGSRVADHPMLNGRKLLASLKSLRERYSLDNETGHFYRKQ